MWSANHSTVADATPVNCHGIPWVETHGYNHLTANAVRNPAGSERDREFWQNKCDSLERTIDEGVYKLYGGTTSLRAFSPAVPWAMSPEASHLANLLMPLHGRTDLSDILQLKSAF